MKCPLCGAKPPLHFRACLALNPSKLRHIRRSINKVDPLDEPLSIASRNLRAMTYMAKLTMRAMMTRCLRLLLTLTLLVVLVTVIASLLKHIQ